MTSNFDRWLTTDTMAEAADAEAERIDALWQDFVLYASGSTDPRDVPSDAELEEHPDHGIYVAWLALQAAIDSRRYRLEVDAEAAMQAESEQAEREWEAWQAENER